MARSRRRCPKCLLNDNVVPILYGMPTYEAFEQPERGEIALAGCTIGGSVDPQYLCRRCNVAFVFTFPALATNEVTKRGWIEWAALQEL